MKYLLLVFLLIILSVVKGQNKTTAQIEFQSLYSSGNELPFWLTHNQFGKYPLNENAVQLLSLNGKQQFNKVFHSPLNIELGTNFITSYGSEVKVHFNELYGKLSLWKWQFEGGLFHEPIYFNGISSTNGNLEQSNNARPFPRIRLSTEEFIPFLFWKNWFSFKAQYDEGLLNDDREVIGTHLHHKSLHLKADIFKLFDISFGLNHYVMWGGTSPILGELPNSFRNYITYITGGTGTYEFPETDRLNVAGNQFGSYLLQFNFVINNSKVSAYINHPFDDHSGMELYNYEDNLYGLFIDFGQDKLFEKVLYEYMFTCDQSGHLHIIGVMTGRDNYYNHGYYKTGYTYNGYALCTPLFSPVEVITHRQAIQNTRVSMHHIGFSGTINEQLKWDGKLTLSRNWGTFDHPYNPSVYQFSSLLNFDYTNTKIPFDLSLALATDFGKLYENRIGGLIRISKNF